MSCVGTEYWVVTAGRYAVVCMCLRLGSLLARELHDVSFVTPETHPSDPLFRLSKLDTRPNTGPKFEVSRRGPFYKRKCLAILSCLFAKLRGRCVIIRQILNL